jgi:hypothetical protein
VLAPPSEGERLEFDIQLTGLPVEATGIIEIRDDMPLLRLKSVERLPADAE